jgi:hypothetical protein
MSNTVSNVLILVEPPAPKVTEKNSGLNIDKFFTVSLSLSTPSSVRGGKNSKLTDGILDII